MYYHKSGWPEEDEILLCTVTNVQYNGVFVKIDEYGSSGMIHISEVSPGRIRNIRDYVQVGKKVVCKVLRINKERGHIDLSLRRVTDSLRRQKNAEMKQELKAEKLLDFYAKENKLDGKQVYQEVGEPILKTYEYIHQAFDDVVAGDVTLDKLGIPSKHAKKLTELIKEKIPPKRVQIIGTFTISTYAEDGVEQIKKALVAAEKVDKTITITYLGNGQYRLSVEADEYETAEERVAAAVKAATAVIEQHPTGTLAFKREERA